LTGLVAAALLVVIAATIEIAIPGQKFYHAGWYNVAIVGLVVVTFATSRRRFRQTSSLPPRLAIAAVLFGTALTGLASAASGLLAPDNQTFLGAPGAHVRVETLGTLFFPIALNGATSNVSVTLERGAGGAMEIGERSRDAGNFILRTIPRDVVYVGVRDLRGNSLTVTQPSGSTFLSPVLLMEHTQTIAGMNLPFDSFNVPAARRIVKAVMFTPAQAAMLLHGGARLGEPAVLFAVDDENERPLANAIALSAGGREVRAGGLRLRGIVGTYPGVDVVAAPNVVATALGAFLAIGGIAALAYRRA
jgi:hypothetical protein